MTTAVQTPAIEYLGNGSTTAFAVPFRYDAPTDLRCAVRAANGVETALAYGTGFTATAAAGDAGGTLTTTTPPASGTTVLIWRETTRAQSADYATNDTFPAETHEAALDRKSLVDQEQDRETARAIKAPRGIAAPLLDPSGLADGDLLEFRGGRLQRFNAVPFAGKFYAGAAGTGRPLPSPGTGADSGLRSDLADPDAGAGLIAWMVNGLLAVPRALIDKLREALYLTPADFANEARPFDKTGLLNSTAAIKALYEHCIDTGATGYVPAGRYKITPGQLFFDNGGEDKAFPMILTAGYAAVTYVADPASTVDEPFIVITNGRAGSANPGGGWTGGDGNYWSGGGHGGITFEDNGTAGARSNRHGFELQGWVYPKFGFVRYKGVRSGSAIFLPKALFDSSYGFNTVGASNPDPCAVTQMDIEGVEALFGRFTIENRNYVGMDSWTVRYVRGIYNSLGGVFGTGQGCRYLASSFGSCAGWAWDDGTNIDAQGGAANRNTITNFEIDDCQYGIRVNRLSNTVFEGIRFNHRYNSSFTPLNTGEGFWPRQCIAMATGALPSVANVQFRNIIHRIQPLEAGVNAAGKNGGPAFGYNALGTLLVTTSPGSVVGVTYDHQYLDNAALGIIRGDWQSGFNINARVTFCDKGVPFFNTQFGNLVHVTYSGGAPSIPQGGFSGASSIVPFNSEIIDQSGIYNPATGTITVPWSGFARVSMCIEVSPPPGTRVQLGVATQAGGAGAYALRASRNCAQDLTGAQTHSLTEQVIPVTKGDVVVFMASNNSGAATALTPTILPAASCWGRFEML